MNTPLVVGTSPARDLLDLDAMQSTKSDITGGLSRRNRLAGRSSTIGTHRALFAHEGERRCDVCNARITGPEDEGGSGLYIWARGDERRFEEPPLCSKCGPMLALLAQRMWDEEEEEEG